MAKDNHNKEEIIVDVEEVYSKTENYIEENKNSLTIIVGAIIVIVGGYFGYQNLYLAPMETEAKEQMWKAEQYFEVDSLNKALNGDGNYFGFQYIIDNYGGTKTANLANYYAGISYLRLGQNETAIEYLESFDSDDQMVGPIAKGAIGDAYMDLGNTQEALNYYKQAAALQNNDFTSPIFLMKSAFAYEQLGNYKKATAVYESLKKDFPNSDEAKDVDKYIARAKTKI